MKEGKDWEIYAFLIAFTLFLLMIVGMPYAANWAVDDINKSLDSYSKRLDDADKRVDALGVRAERLDESIKALKEETDKF